MTDPVSPAISVVIPHYQQPATLPRVLASLAAQEGMAGRDYEIIVVDNGSDMLPEAACAIHPNVRLMLETTKGPGPARSTGAAAARAPIIAFLDSDCVADPGWMAAILARFESDPGADVLGGDVRILPEQAGVYTPIEAYEELYSYRQWLFVARDQYSGAGNMAVKAEVFRTVGPFGGLSQAEDVEWGQRATAAGYRIVYVLEMGIAPPARQTFLELARKYDRHTAHEFDEVHGLKGWARWLAKTVAMPLSPLAEIRNVFATDRLPGGFTLRRQTFCCLVQTRMWRAKRMIQLSLGMNPKELSEGWREVQASRQLD
jgi:cellulose synthase/poly-beta-1,6-N-acetylglucosamine synthase-like glycosyltransferase